MWLIYFGILAASILLPFGCVCLFSKQKQDVHFLDRYSTQIIKGIAICLIAACHCMGKFGGGVTLFTPLDGIGVAIFLILAAYGLNESWRDKGSVCWWKKRFVSVFVPYMITRVFLYWISNDFSILPFLQDVLLLKPRYVYGWYLNYLFVWYLLFYGVMRFPVLRKNKLVIFAVFSVFMFFSSDEIRAEQSLSFLGGIILSEYKNHQIVKKIANWKYGLCFFVVGIISLAIKQLSVVREAPAVVYSFVQLLIKFPCGIGICFVVADLLRIMNLKFFYYVGAVAYEYYLIHGYVFQRVPTTILGQLVFLLVSAAMAVILWGILKGYKRSAKKFLKIIR